MSKFKPGDRVRFKPDHQDYIIDGECAMDRVFVVDRVFDDMVYFGPGYGSGAFDFRLELVEDDEDDDAPATYKYKATPTEVVDTFTSLQEALEASGCPDCTLVASCFMSLPFDQVLDTLAAHDIRFFYAE